jgi:ABC-type nickel/cobalt efflux system permease component RcnA
LQNLIELQRWLYGGATEGLHTVATSPDPLRLLGATAFAVLFGMVHALMPGHGKSVLVSYYLGRPSRILQSVGASAVLVLTHVGMAVVLVLAGFIIVQKTITGAGRAPLLEHISSAIIIVIGLWLLVQAFRGHHHGQAARSRLLSVAAGFVPCPLTTFMMVYTVAHGMVAAGLLVTAAMAAGMVLTISAFAIAAVVFHNALFHFFKRRERQWHRMSHIFEILSAAAVIGAGIWLLKAR